MTTQEKSSALKAADFGQYLTTQYGILRRVFSFLPSSDVRICGEVCQAWERAKRITLSERRAIQCFLINDKTALCPDLYDSNLTLSFSTMKKADKDKEEQPVASKEVLNFVSRYGVIALMNDSPPLLRRHRVELPLTPRTFTQAGVRFPDWDGVTVRTVTLADTDMSEKEFMAALNLDDDVPIKAVIFIVYDNDAYDVNLDGYFKMIQKRDKDCAMGGCRLDWSEDDNDEAIVKCIIFAGENVQAASCVLDNHCRTLKDINARIEELSKYIVPLKNSVILTFRCCDRQKVRRRYNYYPKQNVETWETNALKTYFPSVSVVGCYGVGEFGSDSPRLPTAKRPRLNETGNIEYAFSTIVVYIGFK